MKRKYKSGSEKRSEKKKTQILHSASAHGQTSLDSLFTKKKQKNASKTAAQNIDQEVVLGPFVCVDDDDVVGAESEKLDTQSILSTELENEALTKKNDESTNSEKNPDIEVENKDEPSSKNSERQQQCQWYKGNKLDLNWLLLSNSYLETSKKMMNDHRKRQVVTCKLCQKYESHVKRFTVNGQLPIASGMRADGKDRLKYVVEHLQSTAHEEAMKQQKIDEAWSSMSDSHPWARVLKKSKAETLNFFIHLAVDVYNDGQTETLSARSWPSRSLSERAVII